MSTTDQIAAEAARQLMTDRPYIGAGIDIDELTEAFKAAIEKALSQHRCELPDSIKEALTKLTALRKAMTTDLSGRHPARLLAGS